LIARTSRVQELRRELHKAVSKLEKEKQFNRRVEINATARELKHNLELLKGRHVSEEKTNTPATASAYADAIQGRSDGQFTSRFREQARLMFATIHGGPFFAISRLAPEFSKKANLSVLIVDSNGWYSQAGGRWLSLYAKAKQPPQKVAITICANRRVEYTNVPKPILFQPPQQVLKKSWEKHLLSLDTLPDVTILPAPNDFVGIITLAESLPTALPGRKALISCHLHAEALIIGATLRAYGFQTSETIGFDRAVNQPQPLQEGAWWLSAIAPAKEQIAPPNTEVIEELRSMYQCLRSLLSQAKAEGKASETATIIATRATLSVEHNDVRAACISPLGGIDLDTGRFFRADENAKEPTFVWDTLTTSPDLLARAPAQRDQHSADEDRLGLLSWVTKALVECNESESTLPEHAETPLSPVEAPESSAAHSEPSAFLASKNENPNNNQPASDASDKTVPAIRMARPRLSRRAGTVNVLALAARLGKAEQQTGKIFDLARARILRWLGNKGFRSTNPTGSNHIESPDGEVTIESDGERIWSLRFDDRRSMSQGAIWRVEATLINDTHPALGVRLIQVRSDEDAPPPVASGVPQMIPDLAKDIGLMDAGSALLSTATHLSGDSEAPKLLQLILNPERIQPVIVIAGDIDASADRLAKRLTGVAHVVCIDAAVSQQLIRHLGRERSVYGHAVRLYRPGFTIEAEPYQHPVYPLKGTQLPKWLVNDLFEEACAISLEAEDLDERVPSFQIIRQHLAEQRLRSSEERLVALREQASNAAASKDEQISQLQAIRNELESALAEHQTKAAELGAQLTELREELRAIRRERDDAREELRRSRYQFHAQWGEDKTQEDRAADESYYPDTWNELEEWIEIYGDNKLVLLPQAAKAARESPFKNIPLAYKALDYLTRFYVPMRTRDKDDPAPFQASQQALAELGLELSGVGTALDDRRYKQDYRRQYEGHDIWLDQHLKAGVGFDPAAIFRLYFWYDPDAAKVVVGHLPTHLTNRTTHSG
jgi:hypothetical protein